MVASPFDFCNPNFTNISALSLTEHVKTLCKIRFTIIFELIVKLALWKNETCVI